MSDERTIIMRSPGPYWEKVITDLRAEVARLRALLALTQENARLLVEEAPVAPWTREPAMPRPAEEKCPKCEKRQREGVRGPVCDHGGTGRKEGGQG